MNATPFELKCSCGQCGGSIIFPREQYGQIIPCPHCGVETQLHLAAPPLPVKAADPIQAEEVMALPFNLRFLLAAGLLGIIGALVYYYLSPQNAYGYTTNFFLWESAFIGGCLLAAVPWLIYRKLREIKTVLEQLRDKK